MRVLLGSVRLLTLVLWVGGLAFFALVEAPVAFGMLADTHAAGLVVGGSLRILHLVGLVLGGVFLLATLGSSARGGVRGRLLQGELLLIVAMLVLTAVSQFGIIPRMERARAENGGEVLRGDQGRAAAEFMQLHQLSERVEGGVLFAGLVLIVLLAAERGVGMRPLAGERR